MTLDLRTVADELSAVNLLLASIDEAPSNSLDTAGSVDVASALTILQQVSLAVQMKGWHWNREENLIFSPDSNGEIVLPANTLEVALAEYCDGSPFNAGERNRKLYNRTDHTFQFTRSVTVTLIVALEWDELPIYARRYITVRAAKTFQATKQGNALIDRVNDWEISAANLLMEEAEDLAATANQVTGNAQLMYRLHGNARRRP